MQKLQRHDIIKIEKGMRIVSSIPEKFVIYKAPFSNETIEYEIIVGKMYSFPSFFSDSLDNIKSKIKFTIEEKLSSYSLNPEDYTSNINTFIESLNLTLVKDTFDASIYEGEYKVYYTQKHKDQYLVYCEKLDGSNIEIKFNLNEEENRKIIPLKRNN